MSAGHYLFSNANAGGKADSSYRCVGDALPDNAHSPVWDCQRRHRLPAVRRLSGDHRAITSEIPLTSSTETIVRLFNVAITSSKCLRHSPG